LVRPFWALLALSAVGLILLAVLLTHLQNRNSVESSQHLFENLLVDRGESLAAITLEYAYWDSAVENMVETVNRSWIADNLGYYLYDSVGVHDVFVLNGENETTYAAHEGVDAESNAFASFTGGLDQLLDAARDVEPDAAPIPVNGILEKGGMFYFASAARMTTYTAEEDIGTDHVMIFTQAIDNGFLSNAETGYLLHGIEISPFSPDGIWTASVPLKTADGRRSGYFNWQPDLPGTQMLPILAIGAVFAFAIMAWTAYSFVGRLGETSRHMVAAAEAAERANVAKSDFLRNVAHELRTPVNAVVGFSEIMQQEMYGPLGDPKYAGYAQDIVRAGKHMSELVNDLLDLAKIEAGQMRFETEEVDVNETIRIAIGLVKDMAAVKKIDLELIEDGRLEAIRSDGRAIRQIALNLLANAIKFTPERGRVVCRTVMRASDGSIMIQIQDSGIGISEADLPRVLEPFGRALDNEGRAVEGTGLGLPITKKIAEALGGTLKLSSKFKAGTTATVILPGRVQA